MPDSESTQPDERTNATRRLFNFLERLQQVGGGSGMPVLDVMSRALGMPEQTSSEYDVWTMQIVGGILVAADTEIRRYLPAKSALYLRPFPVIGTLLSPRNSMRPWGEHKKMLEVSILLQLDYAAIALDDLVPEKLLTNVHFGSIVPELDDLIVAVQGADISNQIKADLILKIERLRQALLFSKFAGTEEISRALEQLVGKLITNHELRTKVMTDASGSLGTKIRSVVLAVSTIVNIANGSTTLIHTLGSAIEHFQLLAPSTEGVPNTREGDVHHLNVPPKIDT